jgi:hypothetical protein
VRRLYLWPGLERQQPIDVEVEQYRQNVAAITAAQEAGQVRADIPATELMAMVIALVITLDTASWSLKALQAETGHESFTGRRDAVAAAVAGLIGPLRPNPESPLPGERPTPHRPASGYGSPPVSRLPRPTSC